MGGKSGQSQRQQRNPGFSGKSGQAQRPGGNTQQPSGGKSGKSGGQMQAPTYNAMQNGMQAFGQQMQPTANKWQNYAGMTADPAPSMPPQIGAPQTGAFPYPQAPTQGIVANQPPAQGQAPTPQPAQSGGGSMYQPTQEFYDQVNQTLGPMQMAQKGQYDQGWNAESSPNSRNQAKEWATQMEAALGRPLTREEKSQLNQRAQGWGFEAVKPMQAGWGAQLGQDIAGIQAGTAPGMQFQSADPNELNAHQKKWLGIA